MTTTLPTRDRQQLPDTANPASDNKSTARRVLCDALVMCAILLTGPLWLLARVEAKLTARDDWFAGCSQLLSLLPGHCGLFLRRGFYAMTLDAFEWDCHVGFGTTLAHRQVRIERRVQISIRCTLGCVWIESDAMIGSNVDLLSGRHQHGVDDLEAPIHSQSGKFTPIRVGRDSWIGNSSVVMADIGQQCVIGAGSVVVKPIPSRTVAVGNPCRVVRQRDALRSAAMGETS
jgi:virginiamycin A acetyltransferase